MVAIHVYFGKNQYKYEDVRDAICNALKGNQAFIDSDIIVSDDEQSANTILIILGDNTKLQLNVYVEMNSIITYLDGFKPFYGIPDELNDKKE